MKVCCGFYKSTIGKKVVVAVTGFFLYLFVIAHMLGNLKGLLGYETIDGVQVHHLDTYAHFLREVGAPALPHSSVLWMARIGLIVILVLHVFTIFRLRAINRAARPVGYKMEVRSASTVAANTMWWGGLVLLLFIVYHILHMTTGQLNFSGFREGAVYSNVYHAFRVPYVLAIYSAAMCFLGLHLYHGVWSLFQTLGLDRPDRNMPLRVLAQVSALALFVGFLALPLAVFFGVLPPPIG